MSGVVPRVGSVGMLNSVLGRSGALTFPWAVKLYTNDISLDSTLTASDFVEPSGGGYAPASIANGSNFTVTPGDPSVAAYNTTTDFNISAPTTPGTIYGYFVVDAAGILLGAERLPTPVTPFPAALIRVRPRLRFGNTEF